MCFITFGLHRRYKKCENYTPQIFHAPPRSAEPDRWHRVFNPMAKRSERAQSNLSYHINSFDIFKQIFLWIVLFSKSKVLKKGGCLQSAQVKNSLDALKHAHNSFTVFASTAIQDLRLVFLVFIPLNATPLCGTMSGFIHKTINFYRKQFQTSSTRVNNCIRS